MQMSFIKRLTSPWKLEMTKEKNLFIQNLIEMGIRSVLHFQMNIFHL